MTARDLKRAFSAALAVAFCLAILASPAEAGKKKKKKKKRKGKPAAEQSENTEQKKKKDLGPVKILATAEGHLLAYATGDAKTALEKADGDNHPSVVIARGRVLEQEKRYDEAIAELNRAADQDTDSPAALVYLGETLLHADRAASADDAFSRAESRARKILGTAPDDVEALYYLGIAEQRQKRYGDAIRTLEKARELDPKNKLVTLQLGITQAFKEEWQRAVDTLTEAIELDTGLAYAYYYRGLAAGRADRKDLMINDLDRFLAMAPEAPEAARARKILESA